jgi:hypothetical protein
MHEEFAMTRTLSALLLATLLGAPALAHSLPPVRALPLSEIITAVETGEPVRAIVEVEWDGDGYWEIEYVDTYNRSIDIRVDPATGVILPR